MGLFNFSYFRKNIDKSKSFKENIQNTVLQNIVETSTKYTTQGSTIQTIKVDCSPIFMKQQETVQKYMADTTASGKPLSPKILSILRDPEVYQTMCQGNNLSQIINLDITSVNNKMDDFSKDLKTNLTRNLIQSNEEKIDKDYGDVAFVSMNENHKETMTRIEDNLTKIDMRKTVLDTLTNVDIKQEILIGLGSINGAEQISTVRLLVENISSQILKDVDSTFLESTIAVLEKKTETDTLSKAITEMWNTAFKSITGLISKAVSSIGNIFLGIILMIAIVVISIGPCKLPYISMFCSSKNDNEERSSNYEDHNNYDSNYYYQ